MYGISVWRFGRWAAAWLAVAALAVLPACSTGSPGRAADGRIRVVAAFYPLQFVAERVGGDWVTVSNLTRPGAEPHDLELRPKDVAQIADAGLVLYLPGFQPSVDEAVAQQAKDRALDVTAGQALADAPPEEAAESSQPAGKDPHIWLDPTRLATIADRVAERLAALDKDQAAGFRARAAELRVQLQALDAEYTTGLANCQRREIVTSHAAFGYLAARYRLTQVPISGLSPEAEPSPQRLAEVADLARRKGVTTIFFETLVSPKVAETLAREVGATADVLDPIEGLTEGGSADYLSVMRDNLGRLRKALGCT